MSKQLSQLLIFAKDPASREIKTRLAKDLGALWARTFYRKVLWVLLEEFDSLRERVEPVLVVTPPEAAEDLGERLGWPHGVRAQADGDLGWRLQEAFREANGPALVVGTDMPELSAVRILEAVEAMAPGRVVLGPCPDGGYYLLGLSEPHPELFQGMPWSTGELLGATRRRARELGLEVVELEAVADVDYLEDLVALDRRLRGEGRLGRIIQAVLGREL